MWFSALWLRPQGRDLPYIPSWLALWLGVKFEQCIVLDEIWGSKLKVYSEGRREPHTAVNTPRALETRSNRRQEISHTQRVL